MWVGGGGGGQVVGGTTNRHLGINAVELSRVSGLTCCVGSTEALLTELQQLRSQMHVASVNVGRMGDRMSGSIKALQEVQCVLDERTQTLTIVQARLAESEKALETLRNAMMLRDSTMSDMDLELEALKDSGGGLAISNPAPQDHTRTQQP